MSRLTKTWEGIVCASLDTHCCVLQILHNNARDASAIFREAKENTGIPFGQMLYFDGGHARLWLFAE